MASSDLSYTGQSCGGISVVAVDKYSVVVVVDAGDDVIVSNVVEKFIVRLPKLIPREK